MAAKFTARGYPKQLIKEKLEEVKFASRKGILEAKEVSVPSEEVRPPFICHHSDQIGKKELTERLKPPDDGEVEPPRLCFRKGKDLGRRLVRAKLPGSEKPGTSSELIKVGMKPSFRSHSTACGTPLCFCCKMMSAVHSAEGHRFTTPKNTNCTTRGVIYLLECSLCSRGNCYIGQTGRSLRERMQGHRRDHATKNMPLYRHLRKKDHGFNNLKVTILEVTTNDLLEAEEKWINLLNTRLPTGLTQHFTLIK